MPSPIGSDRLETLEDGRFALACLHPKGWVERSAKKATSAEHPGTAVRWEEQFFEVIAIESRGAGGLRYLLAPWNEQHVFRHVENYDGPSEAVREKERRQSHQREWKWRSSLLLAPLTGLLPAPVQDRMEQEFGAPAPLITFISTIAPMLFGGFCVVWLAAMTFGGAVQSQTGQDITSHLTGLLSMPVLLLGNYLFAESLLRFSLSFGAADRPLGSILGIVPYGIFRLVQALTKRGEPIRIRESKIGGPPDASARERERADLFRAMEPLLSFLSEEDQLHLVERYHFDPLRSGRLTARILLVVAGIVFVNSSLLLLNRLGGPGSFLSLLAGGLLAAEQVIRLRRISGGQAAPSVLGRLVRPFVTPVFEDG